MNNGLTAIKNGTKSWNCVIIGDKEIEAGTVSVRDRTGSQKNGISLDEFIKTIKQVNDTQSLELWK